MKCSNGNLATCWIYISQLRTRIPVPVHNSERLRSLHAYEKKKKKSTREFPQLSRRCPQSKIETDCRVSEGSVKNVSGGLDYGTRQRLRAGRSKPKAPKAPPRNTRNEQRLQVATPSRAGRTGVCCKTTCWD